MSKSFGGKWGLWAQIGWLVSISKAPLQGSGLSSTGIGYRVSKAPNIKASEIQKIKHD